MALATIRMVTKCARRIADSQQLIGIKNTRHPLDVVYFVTIVNYQKCGRMFVEVCLTLKENLP